MSERTAIDHGRRGDGEPGGANAAWLLAQVGAHAAAMFAARLSPIGLTPAHAGILRAVAQAEGSSQRRLAHRLEILPSRLVALMDELEGRGLVERRDSAEDRRVYALYLTEQGRAALAAIGRIAREHEAALCAGVGEEERRQLVGMLRRIADQQGLMPGVHPGYRRMGKPEGGGSGGASGVPGG